MHDIPIDQHLLLVVSYARGFPTTVDLHLSSSSGVQWNLSIQDTSLMKTLSAVPTT